MGHRRRGQGRRRRLRPRRPAHRSSGYAVYSGDDVANLAWLAHGGSGFVSVVGHVAGDQLKAMADAFFAGDHAEALAIFTRLLPAIDAVMGVPNYGATTAKAALQLLGVLDNRNVRAPLVPLDDDEVAALRAGLAAAGLLQPRELDVSTLIPNSPHPASWRRGVCGSSRSAGSARSAAT